MENKEQTNRIKKLERKYDRANRTIEKLNKAFDDYIKLIPDIEELIAYYESDLWREDYEADEEGLLPKDLKRGILSQDGLYDLLSEYQRLNDLINKD